MFQTHTHAHMNNSIFWAIKKINNFTSASLSPHFISYRVRLLALPCTTVYDASTEERLVMTVTSSSRLELSMSMLMERSISRWRLVTMPVG